MHLGDLAQTNTKVRIERMHGLHGVVHETWQGRPLHAMHPRPPLGDIVDFQSDHGVCRQLGGSAPPLW